MGHRIHIAERQQGGLSAALLAIFPNAEARSA